MNNFQLWAEMAALGLMPKYPGSVAVSTDDFVAGRLQINDALAFIAPYLLMGGDIRTGPNSVGPKRQSTFWAAKLSKS
jgi:hypothetical protein